MTSDTRRRPALLRGVVAAAAAALLLAGCSAAPPSASPAAPSVAASTPTRTITDQHGRQTQIPVTVERVAPTIGAFAHITAMLGGSTTIVASTTGLSPLFYEVWPKANPDKHNANNVEEIIAGGAQVVYGPNFTDEQVSQLNKAGVAVITIDQFGTVDQMKSVVTLIGEILGGDAVTRAKEFNAYYDKTIADVEKRVKGEPAVKVLNLRYSGDAYSTVGASDISSAYATSAGGTVVSADYAAPSGGGLGSEQIIAWAPEVIFTIGKAAREHIVNDPELASVPAVKNGKVYTEPSGTYPWSVRSAEGALMPVFLGTILHPDAFSDLSLATTTKEFYRDRYGYELSDDQVKQIIAGSLS